MHKLTSENMFYQPVIIYEYTFFQKLTVLFASHPKTYNQGKR